MEKPQYRDASSFVQDGHSYVGAAVTTTEEVIWAEPLPAGTATQWTARVALTKALELGQGQKNQHLY